MFCIDHYTCCSFHGTFHRAEVLSTPIGTPIRRSHFPGDLSHALTVCSARDSVFPHQSTHAAHTLPRPSAQIWTLSTTLRWPNLTRTTSAELLAPGPRCEGWAGRFVASSRLHFDTADTCRVCWHRWDSTRRGHTDKRHSWCCGPCTRDKSTRPQSSELSLPEAAVKKHDSSDWDDKKLH